MGYIQEENRHLEGMQSTWPRVNHQRQRPAEDGAAEALPAHKQPLMS